MKDTQTGAWIIGSSPSLGFAQWPRQWPCVVPFMGPHVAILIAWGKLPSRAHEVADREWWPSAWRAAKMQGPQGCHPWVAVPRAASGPRPGAGRSACKPISSRVWGGAPEQRARSAKARRRRHGQETPTSPRPSPAGPRPRSRRQIPSILREPQDERNLSKARRLGEPMTDPVKRGNGRTGREEGPPLRVRPS